MHSLNSLDNGELKPIDTPSDARSVAPPPLVIVQSFVNTVDIDAGRDDLVDPPALSSWLETTGLVDHAPRIKRIDLERVIELREAIRAMLIANGGQGIEPSAIAVLNQATERARLRAMFDPTGRAKLQPCAGGVDGAIGKLLVIIRDSMTNGTWVRLKACHLDSCRWVFYDTSKNRSGTWCSMAVCGNRIKTRAYRQRLSARE